MRLRLSGFLLAAAVLGGCTNTPPVAPLASQNPANAGAPAGPAIPPQDFINVVDASAQIALPKVTAGQNLPMAGTTTKPSHTTSGGMGNMPGMIMSEPGGMKMGSTAGATRNRSKQ